jgi:RecJ-like exonuclease
MSWDDGNPVECPKCDGDALAYDCEQCGGEGMVEYMDCPEAWGEDCPSEPNHLITCPRCHGGGGEIVCQDCPRITPAPPSPCETDRIER